MAGVAAVAAVESAAAAALRVAVQRARHAAETAGRQPDSVRLVAVSKTKPVEMLREVYDAGHRHFGENYAQELVEKAQKLPSDIHWHFIGHLQSNKAKSLVAEVPNLFMVETVDNEKIANNLDKAVTAVGRSPLRVLIQVNTSGEESKYGVDPSGCVPLARHVRDKCPNLWLCGLMTIGMPDYSSRPENFQELLDCRLRLCLELGLQQEDLELSMGMSGDFEQAIAMGSTNIRLGSTIFGAREYSKK